MYNKKFSAATHFSANSKRKEANVKSDLLYILGVRWIARLAFVRHVNRRAWQAWKAYDENKRPDLQGLCQSNDSVWLRNKECEES